MHQTVILDYDALLQHIGGDNDFAKDLVKESIKILPEYVADILAAVQANDSLQTKKTAHRLKGGMRTIHAPTLAEISEIIEQAGAARDMTLAKKTIPLLEQAAEETIRELRKKITV